MINGLPKWNAFQDEIKGLRRRDLAESKCLEEVEPLIYSFSKLRLQSNMGIYGTALALKVIEEIRWYNHVSEDPELSRLINKVILYLYFLFVPFSWIRPFP